MGRTVEDAAILLTALTGMDPTDPLADWFPQSVPDNAAISGYPSITIPAGNVVGLPIGVSFIGAEFSDARMIQFAYALEHGGYRRQPPLRRPVTNR